MTTDSEHYSIMNKKDLELYVHIPFCVKKCAYCDFLSGPAGREEIRAYVSALVHEIRACEETCRDYRVCTVFLGGGTPSLLTGEDTARIFHALRKSFDIARGAEITVEANPGTVTEEKAGVWKQCGVTRLSIGLQSADDRELKMLGRIHTFSDFLNTWKLIRRTGFNNVNVDLMSALPGQTVKSWEKTLRRTAELGPEHISAYSLIIEEGTPFYEWYGEGGRKKDGLLPLPDEEEERDMYKLTASVLKEYGFHRYEISNYAKEGYECRHNVGYWERKEYLGLGPGAASLISEQRFCNTPDIKKYMNLYESEGARFGAAAGETEILSLEDGMEEFMFLGLRKTKGIDRRDFLAAFGKDLDSVYGEQLRRLENQGLIACSGWNVRLTERGTDISNYVFSEFIL